MQIRFFCDQMLGNLAKWLRFLGFDTLYALGDMMDDELMRVCKAEDRILITRDKELVVRCKKQLIAVVQIGCDGVTDQILQTIQETKASIDRGHFLSRCSQCNCLLERIEKKTIEEIVPKRVFDSHDDFLYCSSCKRVYWMGTHTDSIIEKLLSLQSSITD
ncbi:MAG: Mut7-C RNAse domain-containing protein [Candidatus Thermoplasmatota archaeon]|nr:Mut7-C RNAse domain-containing protein [Candidatus Thermoplasmatota archaeon]